MTFVITQPCIDVQDRSCVEVCPVDCIHFEEGKDRMLYINPAECIDCGACQPACPVTAIFPEGDVPADQQHFTEINTLWYDDAGAARAKVGGGAAPAPAAPAPAVAVAEVSTEAPSVEAPAAATAAAETATPAPPAAGVARPAAAAVAVAARPAQVQVEATADEEPHHAVVVPSHRLPSPLGVVAIFGFALSFFVMWVFPGPHWITVGGVGIGAGVLLAAGPALLFLLLFVLSQGRDLSRFASHQPRQVDPWRDRLAEWRRSEESRRYELARTVQEIAEARFHFPNERYPDLRTHVNLPEPTMALEIGGGDRTFPDILVVRYPGNYPVIVAQVETRETLTREQAERVWSRLATKQAPLDLYVPAGLAACARDYAKAAGINQVRIRTWRRNPNGMVIREL